MANLANHRSERVDLRMTAEAKRTIQQAAAAVNKTVTEFLLDCGVSAALDTLANRRVFQLDSRRWSEFEKALAEAPSDNPGLRRLLTHRPPWEA